MKRLGRTTAYLLLAALIFAVCSGCAINRDSSGSPTSPSHVVTEDIELRQAVVRYPLTLYTRVLKYGGCTVFYPYVTNENMYLLNLAIRSSFTDFASRCETEGGKVDFSIEFNKYGLLSLKLTCFSEGGAVLGEEAVNFDCDTGRAAQLADCFGAGDTGHLERLSEMVVRYVQHNDVEIIGKLPPVTENTQFLFTYDGLFLVYREYELEVPGEAPLMIKIRLKAVRDIVGKDGLLNRLA